MRIYRETYSCPVQSFKDIVYSVIQHIFIKHILCDKHYTTKNVSPVLGLCVGTTIKGHLKIKSECSYFNYLWFFKSNIKTFEIPYFRIQGAHWTRYPDFLTSQKLNILLYLIHIEYFFIFIKMQTLCKYNGSVFRGNIALPLSLSLALYLPAMILNTNFRNIELLLVNVAQMWKPVNTVNPTLLK